MNKIFEEPILECVKITSEVITEGNHKVPGGDLGVESYDPF